MDILKLIDEAIVSKHYDEQRAYLGASMIGHPCFRYIYLNLIGEEGSPFTAKQLRTFAIGKQLEALLLFYLKNAGFKLKEKEENFCIDEEVEGFQGNCDGILQLSESSNCILEIKTAKNSEYQKFVNQGLKIWNPQYFAQCQSYMGMKKINRCLFWVINKDTSEWLAEWIDFDEICFSELQAKANLIINAKEMPAKINENPCYWVCQSCKYKDYCHKPKSSSNKEWIEEL